MILEEIDQLLANLGLKRMRELARAELERAAQSGASPGEVRLELRYQGAHCRSNNEHNIGVMCLGNFNMQQPTQQQLASLAKLTGVLTTSYRIPANRVYGHQELRSTACPGRNLIGYVRNIRNNLQMA